MNISDFFFILKILKIVNMYLIVIIYNLKCKNLEFYWTVSSENLTALPFFILKPTTSHCSRESMNYRNVQFKKKTVSFHCKFELSSAWSKFTTIQIIDQLT